MRNEFRMKMLLKAEKKARKKEILKEIEVMTRIIAVNKGIFGRESLVTKANIRIEALMSELQQNSPINSTNTPRMDNPPPPPPKTVKGPKQ